jgi:hypothetical protein
LLSFRSEWRNLLSLLPLSVLLLSFRSEAEESAFAPFGILSINSKFALAGDIA